MEPISMIVTALAAGAAAALQPTAEQAIKDAYQALKAVIKDRYESVNVDMLEQDPASTARKEVLHQDLEQTSASTDEEVLTKGKNLLSAVASQPQAQELAAAAGVKLLDVEAGASIVIEDVIASGAGVDLTNVKAGEDLTIKHVRAGQDDSPKD